MFLRKIKILVWKFVYWSGDFSKSVDEGCGIYGWWILFVFGVCWDCEF